MAPRCQWRWVNGSSALNRAPAAHPSVHYCGSNTRLATGECLKALAFMEHAIEEPATRADIARQAGLSVRQLERLFRDRLNSSIAEIYSTIRMEKAERLLARTHMPVTEIAFACGFRNAGHFSRQFGRHAGRSPRAWRQMHQTASTD